MSYLDGWSDRAAKRAIVVSGPASNDPTLIERLDAVDDLPLAGLAEKLGEFRTAREHRSES